MWTRRIFLKTTTLAAGAAGTGLLTPGGRFALAAAPGGELTAAIFADPLTFDPHLTGNIQGRAAPHARPEGLDAACILFRLEQTICQFDNWAYRSESLSGRWCRYCMVTLRANRGWR